MKDRGAAFVIVSADQAAVCVAMMMGFGDQLVLLEEVLDTAGIKMNGSLERHYTKAVLAEWKARHGMGW